MELSIIRFFYRFKSYSSNWCTNIFVIEQGLKKQYIFLVCIICSISDLILIFLGIFLFQYLGNFFNSSIEIILNIFLFIFLFTFYLWERYSIQNKKIISLIKNLSIFHYLI